MFRWRRRNEGFEWREYVRTTVLARRQRRREIIDDAKAAAVFGIRQAGRRGANAATEGAQTLGRTLIGAAIWTFGATRKLLLWLGAAFVAAILATYRGVSTALVRTAERLGPVLSRFAERLRATLAPAFAFFARPEFRLPLVLIGCAAAFSAAHRMVQRGFDGEAAAALAVAVAALVLVWGAWRSERPARARGRSMGLLERAGEALVLFPGLDRLQPRNASLVALTLIAGTAGAAAWFYAAPPNISAIKATAALEGRAVALSGDRLRIAGQTIRLDGIEAPDIEQLCARPSGRWRCGNAAKDALARIMRRTTVRCEITGSTDRGAKSGRCRARGADIAAKLVREGYVFSASGLFARYGTEERAAKDAGLNLWSGSAERPEDYRAKLWEEAKRSAPEGCPIKGRVQSGARVYVLPWSPLYERVRIATARGERWFCSEEEAQAAGWRPVEPS